jgi:CRP-like cAMP-binding protein
LGRRARVTREGLALRIDREDLFDLMSQRPELLRRLFGYMSQAQKNRVSYLQNSNSSLGL